MVQTRQRGWVGIGREESVEHRLEYGSLRRDGGEQRHARAQLHIIRRAENLPRRPLGMGEQRFCAFFQARPEQRVLCTGDLFIWASPNCGNPQKVQRYPREWAAALRAMAGLSPTTLLPGHGPPILGEDRVAQALDETARLLETLVEQTLAAMNGGASLDEVIHTVQAPTELLQRPYLRPVYDEPEFIVRNIWRLYGGWYGGDPSELKPAPRAKLAEELVTLVGGTSPMIDRALALSEQGEHRLACHLVELAWRVARSDPAVAEARRTIYTARAEQAGSVMARGIYEAAAEESKG